MTQTIERDLGTSIVGFKNKRQPVQTSSRIQPEQTVAKNGSTNKQGTVGNRASSKPVVRQSSANLQMPLTARPAMQPGPTQPAYVQQSPAGSKLTQPSPTHIYRSLSTESVSTASTIHRSFSVESLSGGSFDHWSRSVSESSLSAPVKPAQCIQSPCHTTRGDTLPPPESPVQPSRSPNAVQSVLAHCTLADSILPSPTKSARPWNPALGERRFLSGPTRFLSGPTGRRSFEIDSYKEEGATGEVAMANQADAQSQEKELKQEILDKKASAIESHTAAQSHVEELKKEILHLEASNQVAAQSQEEIQKIAMANQDLHQEILQLKNLLADERKTALANEAAARWQKEKFKQEIIQLKAAADKQKSALANEAAAQSQEEELKQEIVQLKALAADKQKSALANEAAAQSQEEELKQEIALLKALVADERKLVMANEAAAQSQEGELKREILQLKASMVAERTVAMANLSAVQSQHEELKKEILQLNETAMAKQSQEDRLKQELLELKASVADEREIAMANLLQEAELKKEILQLKASVAEERKMAMAKQSQEDELRQEIVHLKASMEDERKVAMANLAAAQSQEEELKQEITNLNVVVADQAAAQSQEAENKIKEQQSYITELETKLGMGCNQVSELELQVASLKATARDVEEKMTLADTTHAKALEERDERIAELETQLREGGQCAVEKQNAYAKWLEASEKVRKAADRRIEDLEAELEQFQQGWKKLSGA